MAHLRCLHPVAGVELGQHALGQHPRVVHRLDLLVGARRLRKPCRKINSSVNSTKAPFRLETARRVRPLSATAGDKSLRRVSCRCYQKSFWQTSFARAPPATSTLRACTKRTHTANRYSLFPSWTNYQLGEANESSVKLIPQATTTHLCCIYGRQAPQSRRHPRHGSEARAQNCT